MASDIAPRDRNELGQITGVKGLSDKQETFIRHYARGETATIAAERAGYVDPGKAGYRLTTLPNVMAAVAKQQDKRLVKCASLALDRLREILERPALDHAGKVLQINAAKVVFARLETRARQTERSEDKPKADILNDMSLAELRALAARREEEIAVVGATVVTVENEDAS